jgi:hypothetical protein
MLVLSRETTVSYQRRNKKYLIVSSQTPSTSIRTKVEMGLKPGKEIGKLLKSSRWVSRRRSRGLYQGLVVLHSHSTYQMVKLQGD